MNKCNILFICQNVVSPNFGGIERVTDVLARHLMALGYGVVFLAKKDLCHDGYKTVATQYIIDKKQWAGQLTEIISKHNISVVINQDGLSSFDLLKKMPSSVKKISVMHDSMYAIYPRLQIGWLRKWRWKFLVQRAMKKTYELNDRVVLFVPKFVDENKFFYKNADNGKNVIIPNFNSYDIVNVVSKEKKLLWVGRFAEIHKRTTDMLRIWAKLENRFPEWSIDILGDGPDADKVRCLLSELGLKRCRLQGLQNPRSYYERASIICMTSSFESFGMVLTEGMQHGCVPVAYDSYTAVRYIIHDGVDGILVKPFSVDEYAEKLAGLMSDDVKRNSLSAAAAESVRQFDAGSIMNKWIDMIEGLVG